MKLIRKWQESVQRAEAVILFRGNGPPIVEVVRHSPRGIVLQVSKSPGIVSVDNRVVDEIPLMQVQTHDRPDLGGNGPGLPVAVIDAKLKLVVRCLGGCGGRPGLPGTSMQAAAWMVCTTAAFITARNRQIAVHRQWWRVPEFVRAAPSSRVGLASPTRGLPNISFKEIWGRA